MKNSELTKAILKGMGFRWKNFLVFSLFMGAFFGGLYLWHLNDVSQASFDFSDVAQYQSLSSKTFDIVIKQNGQVLVDGKNMPSAFKIYADHDEMRLILLDNPGIFIQNVTAVVHLPQSVSQNEIEQTTYAVHGVGSYDNSFQDSQTLVYEASDIASTSTLTILTKFPKGLVHPPIAKLILYYIQALSAQSYLILAIILPLVTLLVTLFMVLKRRKDQIISLNVSPSAKPPALVSPAVVGVLLDGRVGPREIAATLIDLAQRGYIYIIRKENSFTFGKRKSVPFDDLPELKSYEKLLLSKIFMPHDYRSTKADVEMRVGHHIFSRKMAQVFLGIYNDATRAGYFIQNPARVHARWKYTGIAFLFLSLLGFVQSAFYAPDPKFTLLFWVGGMAASAVIIKISGLMPARSKLGGQHLTFWMAFRKYLKLHQMIPRGASSQDVFGQYLAYAVVFGVEDAWAKRFMQENFTKPKWYESQEPVITLDEFIGGLFPLISFASELLAESHEPTVE